MCKLLKRFPLFAKFSSLCVFMIWYKTQIWYDNWHHVGQISLLILRCPYIGCRRELRCMCAHLAVFPACRSASLPRVPLCCHVWKQAFALMYNTSLDPTFWCGCWQGSVEEKLVPKDALSGITALTEQQKQHVLHFTRETVSESVYLCYCRI